MMSHGHRPNAAGMTLIHTVFAIALLALFMLIASQLFVHTLATTQSARRRHQQVFLNERVTRRLRADVWRAVELGTPDSAQLVLRTPEHRVTWRSTGNQVLTRRVASADEAHQDRETFHLNADLSFEAKGPMLTVRSRDHELIMVSQQPLWEAQQR